MFVAVVSLVGLHVLLGVGVKISLAFITAEIIFHIAVLAYYFLVFYFHTAYRIGCFFHNLCSAELLLIICYT